MVWAVAAILLLLNGCADISVIQEGETLESVTHLVESESQSSSTPTESSNATAADPVIPEEPLRGFGGVSVLCLKNLPTDRAVQQFAFYQDVGNTYIFTTQRVGTTAYLSRCIVNREQKTAAMLDYVKLENYGHTESMDISDYNGETYLFITSGANPVNGYAWGTTITRLKYENGLITDEKTISGFSYASPNGEILFEGATPYRVNFALDDDADVLAVYVRADYNNTVTKIERRVTTYRLSAVHEMLNTCNSELHLSDCAKWALATTGKMTASKICANGSFQGLEVDSSGQIYLSGGTTKNMPQLSVFQCANGTIARTEIQNIEYISSVFLGRLDFRKLSVFVEIESIKFIDGAFYCIFNPANGMEKNYTEIYLLKNR